MREYNLQVLETHSPSEEDIPSEFSVLEANATIKGLELEFA